jgi:hypothetical protein
VLEHPLRHCRHFCSSAAATSSPLLVKDNLLRPSFFLFWFTRGSPSLSCNRLTTPSLPGASSWVARVPPDPPSSSNYITGTFSSHSTSPDSFARGEHFPPPNSLSLSAHRRKRDLAGAAALPPSGVGRRRGTGVPLDSPVVCVCGLATFCTRP